MSTTNSFEGLKKKLDDASINIGVENTAKATYFYYKS